MCSLWLLFPFTVWTVWESHPKSVLGWSQQDMQSEIFILFDFFFHLLGLLLQYMVTIILVKTQQALCLASAFFTIACKSIFSTRLLFPWLPLCCFLPLFGSLDALESLRLLFSLPSEPLAWELFLLHTLCGRPFWAPCSSAPLFHHHFPECPWRHVFTVTWFWCQTKTVNVLLLLRTMAKLNGYLWQYTKRPQQDPYKSSSVHCLRL